MKKITFLAIICINFNLFSQSKEFIVIDSISRKPIDLVQISYPLLEIGSVTNKDGRIRIPLKQEKIEISHINYFTKKLLFSDFNKKDTLFLKAITNKIDEIIISNLDLKEKVSNILENTYLKKYSTKKAIHKSTYKETFKVNDSLNRLFQVQLNWWSKNALFRGDKTLDKQNKIVLEAVDYSKLKKIDSAFTSANGAYIANDIFFKFIHLNFLLNVFKDLSSDIVIKSIEKDENTIKVYFDATLMQNGKKVYDYKNSLFVFDKGYTSINYLKLNMMYDSEFKEEISKIKKILIQKKSTKHVVELSFKKLNNKKLALNYFISEFEGIIKSKTFTNTVSTQQSLFVSESKLGKRIKKSNIDFEKAFYKNIPEDLKINEVKILLTEEEKAFLKNNK